MRELNSLFFSWILLRKKKEIQYNKKVKGLMTEAGEDRLRCKSSAVMTIMGD